MTSFMSDAGHATAPAGRAVGAVMVGQRAHDGLICLFYWYTRMRLPVVVCSLALTHSVLAIPGR